MKVVRIILRVLAAAVLALVCLVASAAYHVAQPEGWQIAVNAALSLLDDEVRGSIKVGYVEKIRVHEVILRNVEVFDARGKRVIVANRVHARIIPEAILDGVVWIPSGEIDGATLRLDWDEERELPTFIDTFFPVKPSTSSGGTPIRVRIGRVKLSHVTAYGNMPGIHGIRAENLTTNVAVDATDDAHITFWHGGFDLVGPYPFKARAEPIQGYFDTRPHVGLNLTVDATIPRQGNDEHVRARIGYSVPEGEPDTAPSHLHILGYADPIRPSTLAAVGLDFTESLQGEFKGYVSVDGPIDRLRIRGSPASKAGGVDFDGVVATDSMDMTVRAHDLDVHSVLANGPEIRLTGTAVLSTKTTPTGEQSQIRADVKGFDYQGFAVPPVHAEGELQEGRIRIDRAVARRAGTVVTAKGTVGFDGRADLHVTGRLDALGTDPNVGQLLPGLGGAAVADANILYDHGEIHVAVNTTFLNFVYGPIHARRLEVHGRIENNNDWSSVDLTVRAEETGIAEAQLGLVTGRVRGGPVDYRVEMKAKSNDDRSMATDAKVHLGEDFVGLSAENVRLAKGNEAWTGHITGARFEKSGGIRVDELVLQNGGQSLMGRGNYSATAPISIEAEANDLDVGALMAILGVPKAPITGTLDSRLNVSGMLPTPEWRLEGSLDDGKVQGIAVQGAYVFEFQKDHVAVDAQADFMGRGNATLTGSVVTDPTASDPVTGILDGLFDVTLRLSGFDAGLLDKVVEKTGAEARGKITADLHVGGALFAPELAGSAKLPDVRFEGWPPLSIETSLRYENNYLVAHVTTKDEKGELAEAEGALLIDIVNLVQHPAEAIQTLESLPWRVSMRIPERPLSELPDVILERIPPSIRDIRASVIGTFTGGAFKTRGDLSAAVRWEDSEALGLCDTTQPAHALINASLKDDVTSVEARGFVGKTPLFLMTATAATPINDWIGAGKMPAPPPTDLRVFMREVPVETVPIACKNAKGELTAVLDMTKLFTRDVKGKLEVHSASFRLGKVEPFRMDVDLAMTTAEVAGKATFGWWTSERAEAEVSLPLLWDPKHALPTIDRDEAVLTLDVKDAPVEPFVGLLPKVDEAGGRLNGVVEVRGKDGAIDMSGELAVSQGHLQLAATGQRLTDINGNFILHSNWIEIDGIEAHDNKGFMRLDGGLEFRDWAPSHLKLSMRGDHFPIRHEGAALASITGNANIEGEFAESADLVLTFHSLSIDIPKAADREAQALDSHPDIKVVGLEEEKSENPFVISLRLDASRPFWVKRNDFAVKVAAELDATYADPNLFLSGYIEMKEGYFSIYGRKFNLDWGAINFDGTEGIDPSVNFSAVHRLRGGGTVTVTVSGTLSRPEIVFSSTEATDPGEIISLLVTGRAREHSSSSDTGEAERQTADFVGGFLSGFLSLTLREAFGDYLPQVAADSTGFRAGWELDALIPKGLRNVVLGVYFEGQLAQSTEPNADSSSNGQNQNQASTSARLLLELQFPYDLFFEGLWGPPDRLRLDLLWEP